MRRHLGRATALGVAARRRKAGNQPLIRTLQELGVATNLELCLDAGDIASYPGSGYQLLDTSGNDYDFNFGVDGGPDTDNPTFNGTAGALTRDEYLSFDGGDFLTGAAANPAWIESLHKDNAAFTLVAWVYTAAAANSGLFGTSALVSANVGIDWRLDPARLQSLIVRTGSGFAALVAPTTVTTGSAWNFVAVSLDESAGSGGVLWNTNGTAETDTSTYTSPSGSSATYTAQVGALGNNSTPQVANSRMAQFMAWSRALSAAELSDIYTKTRTRFGV